VKVLLYESDPKHPDARDFAKVTNYLVTYASKGAELVEAERTFLTKMTLSRT
jgi:hypothetical protein